MSVDLHSARVSVRANAIDR